MQWVSFSSILGLLSLPCFFRSTIVRARKGKQKPNSTIVQPFLHVCSLQIQHMPSVVGCQTVHRFFTVQHLLMIIFTRPGWIWQLKDDTISSMTFVRSTGKKKVITFNKGYIDMLRLLQMISSLVHGIVPSAFGILGRRIHSKAFMEHRKGYML